NPGKFPDCQMSRLPPDRRICQFKSAEYSPAFARGMCESLTVSSQCPTQRYGISGCAKMVLASGSPTLKTTTIHGTVHSSSGTSPGASPIVLLPPVIRTTATLKRPDPQRPCPCAHVRGTDLKHRRTESDRVLIGVIQ